MLIGRALNGMELSIRLPDGTPAQIGTEGELLISGAAVTPGYLGRPDLTAQRFVTLPDGQRGYLSGDLALQMPSGDFACLGRIDDQIKLNGYRIEPGEVEAVLLSDARVQGAAVLVHAGQLRAFVVSTAPETALRQDLAALLSQSLPSHLQPGRIDMLETLPLTSNGKTDRAALHSLLARAPQNATASPPIYQPIAQALADAFAQVLGQPLDPDLHFFDAGAGSLALMQVHARIKPLAPELLLLDFFAHPTLNALAAYIGNTKAPANMQGQPADIETALADAFAQVLGQPLDPDLHFFDAGAGSLALMQVHARIKPLAPDLTLLDFFVHPTLNALIRHLGPITPMRRQAALPPTQLKSGRIAIIGMAADLPGAADLASLWQMIKTGQEAIVHGPPNRAGHVNAVSSMAEPLAFDPEHFGISARDAKLMDPQQRQLLMGAVKALDHAGIDVSRMPEIGLVLGSSENTYHHALLRNGGPEILDQGLALLHEKDFLATRIAHLLDLRGPALTVQTACSTSLVAVHQACQMLHAGAAQVALAGGAGIDLANLQGYQHRPGDIFSADGHCAPFSADASGTVPANGWGYVVLRPLEDALQAGDRIMAVIDGIAVNNDGAGKVGFTAPSVDGQARVIAAAMSAAGATVATLAYVEGHGTATALGDPIEVEALSRALGPAAAGSVALGSIKSQIGHLGAGAGVAGLIRAVLALWHQTLPPSLGFRAPSAAIDFARLPLAVQTRAAPWPKDRPFAGVSSFGMGGTNAHAVLSAAPDRPNALQTGPQTLLFSARSPTALQRRATEVAQALTAGADLAEMAAALLRAARCEPWRAAVTAQTGAKAAELLARITPRETVASPGLDLPDAADLADAWMRGLEPSRLPQPQARAAWDLPPYPFDTRICLHPAAAGPVATRLHFAEWFSTPVWHRVRVSAAPSLPTLSTNDLLAPGHEVVLTLALEDDAGPLLALLARDGLEMNRLGIRLTVRSDGAFGPEGVLAPDIAMLSGLLRVVAAELPCLHPRLIDAVRTADLPRSEHQGFSQQALRNGRLWHLAEASIAPPQTVLPDPGLYLITGGTGGIGNALAVRIAAQPGCHVTLLARTQPTLSLPKGVSFWALDIADDNEVAAFAANLAAKGERVQGIIHAAGTAGGSVTVRLTPARLAETLHAKRCGAQTLMRHLAPLTDGFILFCSSLSARQGIAGQADYATANAWLDAFAETRTETSPSVISVNWPAWRGIGMNETIRTKGGRLAALAQSLDAGAISADEGWQVFLAAITLGLPQLCVSPLDAATNSATPATPQPAQAATTLAQIFANALGRQTASPTDSFYELGGDSLQALDLIDMVARQGLGTLPASLLAGRLTLAEAEAALATPKATAQLHCLRQGGGVPLVLIHPIGGDIASYRDLVSAIAPNQPVYAIEDPALADAALPARGIPEMAQDYLGRLDKFAEVELLGWSFGGMVAQAMAAISPDKIRQLVLIDPPLPGADHPETAQGFVDEITHHKMLGALPDGATVTHPYLAGLMRAWRRNSAAMRIWQPHPVATPAVIWLALDQGACDERQAAWAALVPDTRFHRLKADHFSILRAPHVGQIAATLSLRQKSAAE
jgi:3-oxoacyl-(acyl-carrier-protein) synthase/thioesterase domain-containing protein/NADP-dependent 3-hydroxy acid dehydrogenase YdfG/aryl carrier-like protein